MGNVAEMRVIVGDKEDSDLTDSNPATESRPEELRILEALLFAAEAPLDEKALAARLPAGTDVRVLLTRLQREYEPRGVNLVRIGGKWTLRTAGDLAWLLTRESVVTRKLSRAAIEILVAEIARRRQGERVDPDQRVLDFTLVERGSVAAPEDGEPDSR